MKTKFIFYLFGILLILSSCHSESSNNKPAGNETETKTDIAPITLLNLYDAFGENDNGFTKDFGFSCLIEYNGKTILFDAGSNADIFRKNVEHAGIDLRNIDFAVVSHAHMDHMNGMDYLLEQNPDIKIYLPVDALNFGPFPMNVHGTESLITDSLPKEMQYYNGDKKEFLIKHSGRFWNADTEVIKENTEILPGIKFIITESPYVSYCFSYPNNDFLVGGKKSTEKDDHDHSRHMNLKELSLSLETPAGEILITGCSHSTVQTITEEALKYTENNIHLLYGGYHLIPFDREYLNKLGNHLKKDQKVEKLAPAHCTGHLAFKILKDVYKENYIYAGLGEKIILANN